MEAISVSICKGAICFSEQLLFLPHFLVWETLADSIHIRICITYWKKNKILGDSGHYLQEIQKREGRAGICFSIYSFSIYGNIRRFEDLVK